MSERGVTHIFVILFILLAIGAGLYLVSRPQVFKSQADDSYAWLNDYVITDQYGNVINCDTTKNPPVCLTHSDWISFTIKPKK